jgi:hypothetical protein
MHLKRRAHATRERGAVSCASDGHDGIVMMRDYVIGVPLQLLRIALNAIKN